MLVIVVRYVKLTACNGSIAAKHYFIAYVFVFFTASNPFFLHSVILCEILQKPHIVYLVCKQGCIYIYIPARDSQGHHCITDLKMGLHYLK